jgi:hypothetical protein
MNWKDSIMSNGFGTDILIQADDPAAAAQFYVKELGFAITEKTPDMISIHGKHINLFIARGPMLGPVLDLSVGDVAAAKRRLTAAGCKIIKDEPPHVYIRDPQGLIYNLAEKAGSSASTRDK